MIRSYLTSLAEPAYRAFMSRLLPTVPKERILGVRMPHIRSLAKRLTADEVRAFLSDLPHRYYEEDMLHACLIGRYRSADACFAELERFLPHVDNWGVCDSLRPRCLVGQRERLLETIDEWLSSPRPFTVRFGIEMLMLHFLDDAWAHEAMERVARVRCDDYYVHMMVAWFFATALTVRFYDALPYLEKRRLSPATHNAAIQKAIDSHRIEEDIKAQLRMLRIKIK